jgi:hypothetical protein
MSENIFIYSGFGLDTLQFDLSPNLSPKRREALNSYPLPYNYGVHTSRITPLNPPLERGEKEIKSSSLPFIRGGLGWGKTLGFSAISDLCIHRSL